MECSIPNGPCTSLNHMPIFLHSSKSFQTSERNSSVYIKIEHMYFVTYTYASWSFSLFVYRHLHKLQSKKQHKYMRTHRMVHSCMRFKCTHLKRTQKIRFLADCKCSSFVFICKRMYWYSTRKKAISVSSALIWTSCAFFISSLFLAHSNTHYDSVVCCVHTFRWNTIKFVKVQLSGIVSKRNQFESSGSPEEMCA